MLQSHQKCNTTDNLTILCYCVVVFALPMRILMYVIYCITFGRVLNSAKSLLTQPRRDFCLAGQATMQTTTLYTTEKQCCHWCFCSFLYKNKMHINITLLHNNTKQGHYIKDIFPTSMQRNRSYTGPDTQVIPQVGIVSQCSIQSAPGQAWEAVVLLPRYCIFSYIDHDCDFLSTMLNDRQRMNKRVNATIAGGFWQATTRENIIRRASQLGFLSPLMLPGT